MKSFTTQIKEEILAKNYATKEERQIFLYSFMRTTGRFTEGKFIFKTTLISFEEKIKKLYHEFFPGELKTVQTVKFVKFIVDDPAVLVDLNSVMGDFIILTLSETRAYLAGAFLGRGWVNSLDSRFYHFEIRVKDYQHSLDLLEAFESQGIKATSLRKKYWYYVYIKKAQDIVDVLRIMEAVNASMVFDDYKIERQFLSAVKKMNSIEPYNREKIDKTCKLQKKCCKAVLENVETRKLLNDNQIKLAKLRLERENLSLSDIQLLFNELYDSNYCRSTINNWFIFINNLYNKTN